MTTTTAPSDNWTTGGPGGWSRMIPHPATGELLPYQRVSTFAKTLDDKGGLEVWKAWCAVKGAQVDNVLLQQALHAEKAPAGVIKQLIGLGDTKQAARRGTDRHTLLAMALVRHPMPDMPDQARQELAAVVDLIGSLGRVVAVETPTVNDWLQVAGTVDLVLDAPDGTRIVCDFKTGARKDPLGWSIQLIAHAGGHWWDQDAQQRRGLVSPDRLRLMVIHAPQDGAAPQAIDMDVARAKRWAQLAADVRLARKEAK